VQDAQCVRQSEGRTVFIAVLGMRDVYDGVCRVHGLCNMNRMLGLYIGVHNLYNRHGYISVQNDLGQV
jgi:hypothetical protein